MCIVQLEGCFLIEFADVRMILFIFCNSCLNTCRNEEILLFQTQFFTCVVVIVRVENFYDISCQVFLFYGFLIITFIERIQLEVVDCFCIPYTQCIYYIVIVTNDRNIKRDRTYRLISFQIGRASCRERV